MQWTWDEEKAAANLRKHGVLFETAAAALNGDFSLTEPDEHPDDDRWRTVVPIANVLLVIIHTDPAPDTPGRIISARRAEPLERRLYEQQIFSRG